MLIRRPDDIPAREITDERLYLDRRSWLATAGLAAAALAPGRLSAAVRSAARGDDDPTPYDKATTYNNYYEFGTGKEDPSRNAGRLRTAPWSVEIAGDVKRPGTVPIETVLGGLPVVERTYRMRCVEAWSMVIPWVGFPLSALLKAVEPLGSAKYVEFVSLFDPKVMDTRPVLDWPYKEGLRLDEAMHPLTLMAVGLYGEVLPNQNGAPVRLVVPWKYGFKSAKSIVTIRLTDKQPNTSWNDAGPGEYGFYSNVNPDVDHPRWSQAKERRIGDFLKRKTLPFNGYADQVASMYAGMDLRKNF